MGFVSHKYWIGGKGEYSKEEEGREVRKKFNFDLISFRITLEKNSRDLCKEGQARTCNCNLHIYNVCIPVYVRDISELSLTKAGVN